MAKQTFTTGQVLTAAQMTTLQANDYNQTVSAKTASYVLVAADAGTRITMSNAGATTITVNTGLFTAGDTLIITNIGAGACTITAGTATVSTAGSLILNQYDTGTLYFSSTSAAIWNGANPGDITGVTAGTGISGGGTSGTVTITNSMATEITAAGDIIVGTGSGTFDNLPIGTTGQILTADTTVSPYKVKWATAAAGSSGLTLIKRASFSGVANTGTTFDSQFTTTYLTYLVIVEKVVAATSADDFQFQFRNGSTTIATDYYGLSTFSQHNSTSFSFLGSSGAAQFSLTENTADGTSFALWIGGVGSASATTNARYYGTGIGFQLPQNIQTGGGLYLSSVVNGILFKSASSNITGTVSIYGLAI